MMHPFQGPPPPFGPGGPSIRGPGGGGMGRPLPPLPPSPGQQPSLMGPPHPGAPFPHPSTPGAMLDQHTLDALEDHHHMQRAAAAAGFGDPELDPAGPHPFDGVDDFSEHDDPGYSDMPPLAPPGSFGAPPRGGGGGGFRPPSAYPYQGHPGGPPYGQQQPWPYPDQGIPGPSAQRYDLGGRGASPGMGGFPSIDQQLMGPRGPQPLGLHMDQPSMSLPRGGGANFGQGQGLPYPSDPLAPSHPYYSGDDYGDDWGGGMGAGARDMEDGASDDIMNEHNKRGMFNFGKSVYPTKAYSDEMAQPQTTGNRGLFDDEGGANRNVGPPPMGYRGGPPRPVPLGAGFPSGGAYPPSMYMGGGGGGGGRGGDPRMIGGGGTGAGYGDPRMMGGFGLPPPSRGGPMPYPGMRQPTMPYQSDRPHQVAVNARFVHQNELLLSGESWITSVPLSTRGSDLWALALGANDRLNRMDLKPTGTILVATAGNENMVSMRLSDPIGKAWTPIRRFFVFLVFPKPDIGSTNVPPPDSGVCESPKSGSGGSGASGSGSRSERPRHVSFRVEEADKNGGGSEFAAPAAGTY